MPQPPRRALLPPELQAKLPLWRATADEDDPVASVKLFLPGTYWSWYIVEYDGKDTCFGLVDGLELEAGYFSLRELEEVENPMNGLPVERDEQFTPTRLSELRRELDARVQWTSWTPIQP